MRAGDPRGVSSLAECPGGAIRPLWVHGDDRGAKVKVQNRFSVLAEVDAEENEKPHRINTIRFKHWIKDIWVRFAYNGLFGTFDHVGNSLPRLCPKTCSINQ